MGKRVSFELADIIDNEFVKVSTHCQIVPADDQFPRATMPQAHVYLKVGESETCFAFDVEVFQHRIRLSCDFNAWSDNYMAKVEFLGCLGCSYTVI